MGRLCCSPFSGLLLLKKLEDYLVIYYAVADFISAILIRATGCSLIRAHIHNWKSLGLDKLIKDNEVVPSGDVAALVYLWNPFTIVSCIGFNTSPIENMFVIMSLYGASAAFQVEMWFSLLYFGKVVKCFLLIILVVESVSAMLNHDRKIRKLYNKV